jgi:ketosteroid isomerase-like protein
MEHFYRYDRPIRSGRHQLDSVVAAGTEIAVRGSFRGDLRDGGGVAHRFAEFFRIGPDGRFTARETFFAVPHV